MTSDNDQAESYLTTWFTPPPRPVEGGTVNVRPEVPPVADDGSQGGGVMAYVLVDDLTRQEITDPDHVPTELSVDGHAVELDLSPPSQEQLRDLLAPYYAAGRSPGTSLCPRPEPGLMSPWGLDGTAEPEPDGPPDTADPDRALSEATDAEIRKWARKYGVECSPARQVQPSVRALYVRYEGGPPPGAAAPSAPPREASR